MDPEILSCFNLSTAISSKSNHFIIIVNNFILFTFFSFSLERSRCLPPQGWIQEETPPGGYRGPESRVGDGGPKCGRPVSADSSSGVGAFSVPGGGEQQPVGRHDPQLDDGGRRSRVGR